MKKRRKIGGRVAPPLQAEPLAGVVVSVHAQRAESIAAESRPETRRRELHAAVCAKQRQHPGRLLVLHRHGRAQPAHACAAQAPCSRSSRRRSWPGLLGRCHMSCTTNALSSRLTCYTAARTSHRSSALYRVSEPQLNLANTVWAFATADEQRMKDQGVQPNVISFNAAIEHRLWPTQCVLPNIHIITTMVDNKEENGISGNRLLGKYTCAALASRRASSSSFDSPRYQGPISKMLSKSRRRMLDDFRDPPLHPDMLVPADDDDDEPMGPISPSARRARGHSGRGC